MHTIPALVDRVRKSPTDGQNYDVLADHMRAAGLPGHETVRAAGRHAEALDAVHLAYGIGDSLLTRKLLGLYGADSPGLLRRVKPVPEPLARRGMYAPAYLRHTPVAGYPFVAAVPGGPLKLARHGDRTGDALAEGWRRNPDDDTAALVYADWLEENGRDAAAHRLRWWIGARDHLRSVPAEPITTAVHGLYGRHPEWVQRLLAAHTQRALDALHPDLVYGDDPAAESAIAHVRHTAERHALGLDTGNELASAREALWPHIMARPTPTGDRLWSVRNLGNTLGIPNSMGSAASAAVPYEDEYRPTRQLIRTLPVALGRYSTKNPPPAEGPAKLARGDAVSFSPKAQVGFRPVGQPHATGASSFRPPVGASSFRAPAHVPPQKAAIARLIGEGPVAFRPGVPPSPRQIVDRGMARWRDFAPTEDSPFPSSQMEPHEWDGWIGALDAHNPPGMPRGTGWHYGEFHDAAATLAGVKPAFLAGAKFLQEHPVGREITRRARASGAGAKVVGGTAVVGHKGIVGPLADALGRKDHATVGRLLGYPTRAVERFVGRQKLAREYTANLGDMIRAAHRTEHESWPAFDGNAAVVLADALQEAGHDGEAELVRRAVGHNLYEPFGGPRSDETRGYPGYVHPAVPGFRQDQHLSFVTDNMRNREDGPVRTALYEHYNNGGLGQPVIRTTLNTQEPGRRAYVEYVTPLTHGQLHDYIDALEPREQEVWRSAAGRHGWRRPAAQSESAKLARSPKVQKMEDDALVRRILAARLPATGLPPAPRLLKPLEDQRAYHRAYGARLGLEPFTHVAANVKLNESRSRQVAELYDRMTHDPNEPTVKKSYDQFKKEILLQYKHMTDRGLKVEPWRHEGQPYTSSDDMRNQVEKYNHLYYPIGPDQIPPDHPLAEQAPGHPPGVTYSDLFRAAHDYFGHAVHHNSFGPLGEQKAWVYHARMFSPLARRAMTTETHGQNSWVNYGPHKPWTLPPKDRPFAPQKAGILKLARAKVGDLFGGYRRLETLLQGADQRRIGADGYVTRLADGAGVAVERHGRRLLIAHDDGTFTFTHDHPTPSDARVIDMVSGASVGFGPYDPPTGASARARNWTGIYSLRGAPRQAFQPGKRWHPKTGYPAKSERDQALAGLPAFALADWMQENGVPGAHIARAHAETLPYTNEMRAYDAETGGNVPSGLHNPRPGPGKDQVRLHWWRDMGSIGRPSQIGPFVVSSVHAPDNPDERLTHHATPVHSLRHLYSLLSDFHPAARKNIIRSLKGSAVPKTSKQDGPLRLARVVAGGQASANRAVGSDNHAKRVELARRVLSEAGLRGRARAVLSHTNGNSRPAVMASAAHATNPQHALYAAAWLGLMTQEPRMTVFRPGEEGEDTLHVFDSPHPADHVANYLRSAGVPSFLTEPRPGGGSRAMIVNPLNTLDPDTLARGLNASHTAVNGRADRIGASPGSDAGSAKAGRAAYRQVIADAESSAGLAA